MILVTVADAKHGQVHQRKVMNLSATLRNIYTHSTVTSHEWRILGLG